MPTIPSQPGALSGSHHAITADSDPRLMMMLFEVSPVFSILIFLSFLFIIYKYVNKYFLIERLTDEQLKKEIDQQTIGYAVFMSSIAGFLSDMYLSLPVSIFIACCFLYIIYLFVRFLAPKK
jgi:hypothetical protein